MLAAKASEKLLQLADTRTSPAEKAAYQMMCSKVRNAARIVALGSIIEGENQDKIVSHDSDLASAALASQISVATVRKHISNIAHGLRSSTGGQKEKNAVVELLEGSAEAMDGAFKMHSLAALSSMKGSLPSLRISED